MAGDMNRDATALLGLLGDKDNIVSFTHCATRMRYVLKDHKKTDIEKIESLPSVKGSFTQGGQYQVIIGTNVADFYDEFVKVSGLKGQAKQEVKQAAKSDMNLIQKGVSNLAEIFVPIIPAIIVGGLILGFRNVIGDIKMLDNGTKTIASVFPFWQGTYDFLWLIGEAIFIFLPVMVTWSVCKKMKVDQALGIVLGLTLVSPQLMSASDYIQAVKLGKAVKNWDFGAFHINMVGYQSQVIPAILVGILFAYLYRFFKKHIPDVVSMIFVPFLSLIPAVILAHTIVGPFGRALGDGLAGIIMAGFNSPVSWLFSGIYGLLYPLLVITGLHHSMLPIDLQTVATMGGIYTFPVVALSNIAQATATMAFVYINRKDKAIQEVGIPSFVSGFLGVTEPAMFGINLKYFYPFVSAMLAAGIMGCISRLFGVIANSVGVGGIPAFLSMRGDKMLIYLALIVIDIILSFVLTLIISKTKIKNMGYKKG